jgi:hypothetical protein
MRMGMGMGTTMSMRTITGMTTIMRMGTRMGTITTAMIDMGMTTAGRIIASSGRRG